MIYYLLGFSSGALVMWLWFYSNKLIRSREEWNKATGRTNDHL